LTFKQCSFCSSADFKPMLNYLVHAWPWLQDQFEHYVAFSFQVM
jgi:hypothetical protein